MSAASSRSPGWIVGGTLLGVVVGVAVGVVVGPMSGSGGTSQGLDWPAGWPEIRVAASATETLDKFAIATGLVDNGMEAIYFLDYLTGDLRAAVINPKTGKFNAFFSHNIAADFNVVGGAPRYMIVTGLTQMPRGKAGFQYASSSIYVAEANSGQVVAYTIPWNSSAMAAGRPQSAAFVPLDRVEMRTAFVRDE